MDFTKITNITLALLETESNINENSKTNYVKKISASFKISKEFLQENSEEKLDILCESIFMDILNKIDKNEIDSLGIWINYNEKVYENSIKLQTLNDISLYSHTKINPVFEFLKMTLVEI